VRNGRGIDQVDDEVDDEVVDEVVQVKQIQVVHHRKHEIK
jgi:hypothetical protein